MIWARCGRGNSESESVSCSVISDFLLPHGLTPTMNMEFSSQEYLSGLPFPSPGDVPNPETEPGSSVLQADSLLTEPPRKT